MPSPLRIRFISYAAGPDFGPFNPGDELVLPYDRAKEIIDAGHAIKVELLDPAVERAVLETPERAVGLPQREVTVGRPQKERTFSGGPEGQYSAGESDAESVAHGRATPSRAERALDVEVEDLQPPAGEEASEPAPEEDPQERMAAEDELLAPQDNRELLDEEALPEPSAEEQPAEEQGETVSAIDAEADSDQDPNYQAGRQAAQEGQPRSANPNDGRTAPGRAWLRGYDAAGSDDVA